MELIQVGEKTFYLKNPTNIGIYKINEKEVYLIDSGNDKEAGRKILKLVGEQRWIVKGIIATHSNADHIGGNKFIQDRTGCEVLAFNIEKCFTQYPILESSFLYGGYPFRELRNKFLCAKESIVSDIDGNLPSGLEYFSLRGHFFDMIGIKTSDDVYFLADSLFSEDLIKKYHLFFIYDVKEFLNTLEFLGTLKGKVFIPSHTPILNDITPLIDLNKNKIMEICEKITNFCGKGATFEQVLKKIFDEFDLVMNANQYVLIGSTVKSYLSYLEEIGKIEYFFENNQMIWKKIEA